MLDVLYNDIKNTCDKRTAEQKKEQTDEKYIENYIHHIIL